MRSNTVAKEIGRLREQGYEVYITHLRSVERVALSGIGFAIPGRYPKHTIAEWGHGYRPGARGGTGVCVIKRDGVAIAEGRAECSEKDNFNGSLASAIAFGRAYKQLKAYLATPTVHPAFQK